MCLLPFLLFSSIAAGNLSLQSFLSFLVLLRLIDFYQRAWKMKMVVLFLLLLLFSLLPSLFSCNNNNLLRHHFFLSSFFQALSHWHHFQDWAPLFCSDCKDWSITLPPLPPPLNFFSWSHLLFPSFIITDSPSGLLFPVHQLNYHHLLLLLVHIPLYFLAATVQSELEFFPSRL